MKVPVSTLVPLPDSLSFVTGAAISCGTGTAWGALRRVQLQGGETIAIFGQGPVGLSATQLAVEMGARVIAIDIAPERRKLARQFGAAEHRLLRVLQRQRAPLRPEPEHLLRSRGRCIHDLVHESQLERP